MNIMRYKWSAVLAAGLHGALFITLPHARVIPEPVPHPAPLEAMPTELIQIENPEPADTSETAPPASIPGPPVSPEPPPMPTVTPPTFTTPIHEPTAVRTLDYNRLFDHEGLDGVPHGTGTIPRGIDLSKDLDRVPRAIAQISPDYPADMRQRSEMGSVLIEFDVDTSGRVVRAEAVRFSRREFVEPAVRAVLKWRFESGKRNGVVVPFRMVVPIEFNGMEN